MSDLIRENWIKIGMAVLTLFLTFIWNKTVQQDQRYYEILAEVSKGQASSDAKFQAIQYQIAAITKQQTDTIPPVVEASLREIREKGNSQAEGIQGQVAKLTETAINNAKDIGYLKEQLARAQRKP